MGLFSFFKSCKAKSPEAQGAMAAPPLSIDLSTFKVGDTVLGERPAETDFFAAPLQKSDVFEVSSNGVEIGIKDGVLDSVFLTIKTFHGQFRSNG